LEVLVSMTILSLIMVVIVSAFHLGNRAWTRGERDIGKNQQLRFGLETLIRDISSTHNYRTKVSNQWVTLFIGKPDSLHFITTVAANISRSTNLGIYQIAYYVGSGDNGQGDGLVREEFPITNGAPFAEDVSSRINLLPFVEEVSFEYLYRKTVPQSRRGMQLSTADDLEDEWVEYWGGVSGDEIEDLKLAIHPGMSPEMSRDSRRMPPRAVRITLRFGRDPSDERSEAYTMAPFIVPIYAQTEY